MERWLGKTAVVTGASAGIGAATAVKLANAGLRVVGLARRPQLVDELRSKVTSDKGSIQSRQCDVSNSEDVAAAFKWIEDNFGVVHILVNNAGAFLPGQITSVGDSMMSEEKLWMTININVKGVIMCTRHAVDAMVKHGVDGHVVTINSIAGHYVPNLPIFNVYPATKHAVTVLMQNLDKEFVEFNRKIKTTSVSPGLVNTDMALEVTGLPILQPEDVADAVLYAVSTPPQVNITEITVTPVGERRM